MRLTPGLKVTEIIAAHIGEVITPSSTFNGVPDPDDALGNPGDVYIQHVGATTTPTSILKATSYNRMDNGYYLVTLNVSNPWFEINTATGQLSFVAPAGESIVIADNSKLTLASIKDMPITIDFETTSKVTGHIAASFLPAIKALTGHVEFEITADVITSGASTVIWNKNEQDVWVKQPQSFK